MYKKIPVIILCMLLLIPVITTTSATYIEDENKVEINNGKNESGFMVGIMHVKHVKTGWGWTEVWTPIFILRTGLNGRYLLGPSSGSFTPYDIAGYVGPLYYVFSNPYISGPFLICAHVSIWDFCKV